MTLSAGARLGPYEITSPLGAGGMGEVYRARDTRLDRTVAIKVLPEHLSSDPERRQRFEREARAVSSLNHPHICVLHDIGHQDGTDYIVMEYLEGETLASRLGKSPLPLDQALRCGIEIADALDKAHKQGVVHRDLKPANIMLTNSGAKLLDFGLAKRHVRGGDSIGDSSGLLTQTHEKALTGEGRLLGTLQYMAPEQLEGREADSRTDIFALGSVLYEMVTGKKAFEGKSSASLIAAILDREPPPVSSIQPLTPRALDRVVKKCLAKEPEKRWQSASDLTDELRWIAEGDNAGATAAPAARRGSRARAAWIIATCLALALAASLLMRQAPAPSAAASLTRFPLLPPEQGRFEGTLGATGGLAVAVAPDGRHIVFPATSPGQSNRLWIRGLDALAPQQLAATVNGDAPFWSPDGQFLGFFADGKLKKIAVSGGPAQTLADAPSGQGGTWSGEEVIVFAPSLTDALYRLSAAGGKPVPVTRLDAARGETSHQWPQFLPDHRHFLYYAYSSQPEQRGIRLGTLDGPETTLLVQADSQARYAAPGHLLFVRAGTLLAQPFDARRLELRGEPVPVAEQVTISGTSRMRNASFAISSSGVLVYGQGSTRPISQLQWHDRSGKTLGSPLPPAEYNSLALSPDGQRVAFTMVQSQNLDVWVLDLARGTSSRLTFDPAAERLPLWSPDGSRIAFRGDSTFNLYQRAATGTGQEELLLKSSETAGHLPTDWSTDGRFIVYSTIGQRGSDLWVLTLAPERKASPYLQGPFNQDQGRFSPDGRWVAYISDESGRYEVYVQPFPATGGKWQISRDGGAQPVWRRDGKELFYLAPDSTLMALPVTSGGAFEAGTPVPLFKTAIFQPTAIRNQYAVSADGRRFLIITPTREMQSAQLTVVLNWTAALKK